MAREGVARLTDEEFASIWASCKSSPALFRDKTGMAMSAIYRRRASLAKRGIVLETIPQSGAAPGAWSSIKNTHRQHLPVEIGTGTIIAFSDAHYWPGEITTAHKALIKLIKQLKPSIIIANGDVFDGARISRHGRIGWENSPSVKQELEAVEERLHEIIMASPNGCRHYWTWGNHDLRFDTFISNHADQLEGLVGMSLEDRFPEWEFATTIDINGELIVKHRYHNGVHAGYNNALKSGRSICTGHLHRLLVTPFGDYNGRRWGIDTGTLADPDGPQFGYMEGNPAPWCSGFAVISFHEGRLVPPELVEVIDNRAWFRGGLVYDGQE